MAHDPLFNIEMTRKLDRITFLWRGFCLGSLVGYLFSPLVPANTLSTGSILVVATILVLTLLPNLAKAWIEQRNRMAAYRDGTLMQEVGRRRKTK